MGLTAMIIGGISGTGMHMMNNAMHKVPLSRRKFLVMFCILCGGGLIADSMLVMSFNQAAFRTLARTQILQLCRAC